MHEIKEKIKELAKRYKSETIAIREHLHTHPELSFQEFQTAQYIAGRLQSYGISFTEGMVQTGIVAVIEGKNPSRKTVALRADMDALPIQEENNVPYRSVNNGIMHACGHDVHSASLLGAARILQETKDSWEGTVKLIFQPGEELLPGGASLMIKAGALKNPVPQSIIGQHVFPSMETGKVGFRSGMYMASTDEIYVTVKGKGGHAAMPKEYNNPIFIASRILLELQEVFMKQPMPLSLGGQWKEEIPTVLAFGKVTAAGATNVIPAEVKIEGTFRTMHEEWRAAAHILMIATAQRIANEMGGSCDFNIEKGYPFLVNDPAVTEKARQAAEAYLGKDKVEDLPMRMTGEDFAFYTHHMPACFYRLGTANKSKGITSGVHTATFDVDADSLEIGSGLMAWLAVNELK
jgi:amidohydrolase